MNFYDFLKFVILLVVVVAAVVYFGFDKGDLLELFGKFKF